MPPPTMGTTRSCMRCLPETVCKPGDPRTTHGRGASYGYSDKAEVFDFLGLYANFLCIRGCIFLCRCHLCEKQFTERGTLNRHIATVHTSEQTAEGSSVVYQQHDDDESSEDEEEDTTTPDSDAAVEENGIVADVVQSQRHGDSDRLRFVLYFLTYLCV